MDREELDAAEAPTHTFEREQDFSILEELEADLAELEAALAQIDDGSHGDASGHP